MLYDHHDLCSDINELLTSEMGSWNFIVLCFGTTDLDIRVLRGHQQVRIHAGLGEAVGSEAAGTTKA